MWKKGGEHVAISLSFLSLVASDLRDAAELSALVASSTATDFFESQRKGMTKWKRKGGNSGVVQARASVVRGIHKY